VGAVARRVGVSFDPYRLSAAGLESSFERALHKKSAATITDWVAVRAVISWLDTSSWAKPFISRVSLVRVQLLLFFHFDIVFESKIDCIKSVKNRFAPRKLS
jgi:hypothetical protein